MSFTNAVRCGCHSRMRQHNPPLPTTQGVPDKGWVKVTKLESCTGEASVSNRKGKRIVAYELNVKCIWEGQVDYDDVSGELLMPYISEDVSDSAYETKLTAKEPTDARPVIFTPCRTCPYPLEHCPWSPDPGPTPCPPRVARMPTLHLLLPKTPFAFRQDTSPPISALGRPPKCSPPWPQP